MKLIPAMSIKDGRVAVVDDGRYTFLRNPEGRYRSPVSVLKGAGFPGEEVFILDLDGLERNSPDLDAVKRAAAYRDVWLDAGTVDSDSMMDLFVSDASKVVMGTLSLRSLDELASALEMSDNVIFSIAFDGSVVSPDAGISGMSPDELLGKISGMNIREAMLLDLGGIRGKTGIDPEIVSKMAGRFGKFYVSGRIAETDLKPLEDAGAAGAVMDFRTLEAILRDRA